MGIKNKHILNALKQPLPVAVVNLSQLTDIELTVTKSTKLLRRTVEKCKVSQAGDKMSDGNFKKAIIDEVAKHPTLEYKRGYIQIKDEE